MGEHFQIVTMDNTNPNFYKIMGPYLSNRKVVAELGYPVWDDNDKVWFVALKDDIVIGWCAAINKKTVKYCSDYILPAYRESGVYKALYKTRDNLYKDKLVRATITDESISIYLENGFMEIGKRGKYTNVARNIE